MISKWKWAAAWLLAGGGSWAGAAWADAPSEQQVRQLLQVIGIGQNLQQMNTQAALMMHKQLPCVPGSFWQQFAAGPSTQQLIRRMIPVYQKYFTADDIKGLTKFYATPLGRKVLTAMPAAMAEVGEINQQWSRERIAQLESQLKAQGRLGSTGQCPAAAPPPIVPDDLGPDEGVVINASRVPAASHHHVSNTRRGKTRLRHRPPASQHKAAPSNSKPVKSKAKPKPKAKPKTTPKSSNTTST